MKGIKRIFSRDMGYRIVLLTASIFIIYRLSQYFPTLDLFANQLAWWLRDSGILSYIAGYISYINIPIIVSALTLIFLGVMRGRVGDVMVGTLMIYGYIIFAYNYVYEYAPGLLTAQFEEMVMKILPIEAASIILTLSILHWARYSLFHRRLKYRFLIFNRLRFTADMLLYLSIIIVSTLTLYFTHQYIIWLIDILTETAPIEIRILLDTYLDTSIGEITLMLIVLGFIGYILHNIVEPLMIYLSRSRGQALGIIQTEYTKIYRRERGYIYDTDRYLVIGLIILIIVAILPLYISILIDPGSIPRVILRLFSDILLYRHSIEPGSSDQYINDVLNLELFELLWNRIQEFIRLILYLLY